VTATRKGLTPASVKIESRSVEIIGGLMRALPPTLPGPRGAARKTLRPNAARWIKEGWDSTLCVANTTDRTTIGRKRPEWASKRSLCARTQLSK
jgi:hypothetical protein